MCICGVIGYMDEKLLDSCCGLRYIRDMRCGICYAFIEDAFVEICVCV